MSNAFVAIMMGSDSDLPVMQAVADVLDGLDIPSEMRIMSAHRTPKAAAEYVVDAQARGCRVYVCGAGLAAHLAGAVAAYTTRPVIGVPLNGALDGMDSLLSTVQMPPGVPVATVAIGKHGAKNAGYLAAQMLGLGDEAIAERVAADRKAAADKVRAKDAKLQKERR